MLEIIILFVLCRNLGKTLRAKGYTPFGYQAMLVVLYYAGAFGGGIVGGVIAAVLDMDDTGLVVAVFCAILGAVAAAVGVFTYAKNLPDRSRPDEIDLIEPAALEKFRPLPHGAPPEDADAIRRPRPDGPRTDDDRIR